MKEFVDKLIGRLEEFKSDVDKTASKEQIIVDVQNNLSIDSAINIINRLAEEYKNTNIITDFLQYARDNADNYDTNEGWSLADLIDLSIKYSEEYINTSTEHINTSTDSPTWIPCERELPKEDKKTYIVQKTNGSIDILGFTKDAYKLSKYDFTEYKGKKKSLFYGYDSEYGYIEWECVAWMPLPQRYKAGD